MNNYNYGHVIYNGNDGWSTAGVTIVRINDSLVNCTSTHLTNFATLVDVSRTKIVINSMGVLFD